MDFWDIVVFPYVWIIAEVIYGNLFLFLYIIYIIYIQYVYIYICTYNFCTVYIQSIYCIYIYMVVWDTMHGSCGFCSQHLPINHSKGNIIIPKPAGLREAPIVVAVQCATGWWFQICFLFTTTWGNDPIWLLIFKGGWNHQLGKQSENRSLLLRKLWEIGAPRFESDPKISKEFKTQDGW